MNRRIQRPVVRERLIAAVHLQVRGRKSRPQSVQRPPVLSISRRFNACFFTPSPCVLLMQVVV
jgi:hypothetical protein